MTVSKNGTGRMRSQGATRSPVQPRTDFGTTMPGWQQLKHFSLVASFVSCWFVLIYGTCDWVTSLHTYRLKLGFDWESRIPFYPPASLAYMSIYPLFLLIPFVIQTRHNLNLLAVSLVSLIGCSGLGFLFLPAYPISHASVHGFWGEVFHIADAINLNHNHLPSLHVGLAVACVSAMSRHTSPLAGMFLWIWATAVAASTLLLRQHYLVDVVTGWCLALICVRVAVTTSQSNRITT